MKQNLRNCRYFMFIHYLHVQSRVDRIHRSLGSELDLLNTGQRKVPVFFTRSSLQVLFGIDSMEFMMNQVEPRKQCKCDAGIGGGFGSNSSQPRLQSALFSYTVQAEAFRKTLLHFKAILVDFSSIFSDTEKSVDRRSICKQKPTDKTSSGSHSPGSGRNVEGSFAGSEIGIDHEESRASSSESSYIKPITCSKVSHDSFEMRIRVNGLELCGIEHGISVERFLSDRIHFPAVVSDEDGLKGGDD